MALSDWWRRVRPARDAWDLTPEEEAEQEIETHLELRVTELVRAGMTPEAAGREAIRRFGDLPAARESLRRSARRRVTTRRQRARVDALLADLRLAGRQIRRSPRFTLVAIATLAIGIGATTATFTLVRSVILRPLPFPRPDRLVGLESLDSNATAIPVVSSANWLDWQRGSRALESTALHMGRRMAVTLGDEPVRVDGELVTSDYFRVLQAGFVTGRSFTAEEVRERAPVAVVSEGFWRRMPHGVGDGLPAITVDARSYQVVGVVRQAQAFPAEAQVFLPVHVVPESGALRNSINWYAIGRLAPGVTPAQARAELDGIARGIRAGSPEAWYSWGVPVRPLKDVVVGDTAGYLVILMGAVVLVLLVACANLAAAHLARGLGRSRDTAVRAALGADRGRLVQQVLVEHGLLGLVGGGLGILLAWGGLRGVLHLWGERIPRSGEVTLDLGIMAFAVVLSVGAGLVTGLAPAFQASRPRLAGLISAGGRGTVRGGRGLPGGGLIAAEVALALVLLTGAGLLIRSLQHLLSRDLGFDTSVLTVSATLADQRYRTDPARRVAYWDQVSRELAALPGVTGSGVATWVPMKLAGTSLVELENGVSAPDGFGYRAVSEGYLRAIGVPLLEGREFASTDLADGPRVVLINRAAARVGWPGQSPVGQRFRATGFERGPAGEPAPWLTIVGVVGDLRQWGPYIDPRPEMYVLFRQVPAYTTAMTAVARTATPPAGLIPAARERLRAIDPAVALEFGTFDGALDRLLAPQRLPVSLLSGFGVFALLLTALGLYGLLAYSVSLRQRELALRAALGARRGQLVRTAALGGLRLVAIGALVGLVGAAGASRFLAAMLFDITPFDPLTYALVTGILAAVALLAILPPVLRGTRLDPARALNVE